MEILQHAIEATIHVQPNQCRRPYVGNPDRTTPIHGQSVGLSGGSDDTRGLTPGHDLRHRAACAFDHQQAAIRQEDRAFGFIRSLVNIIARAPRPVSSRQVAYRPVPSFQSGS